MRPLGRDERVLAVGAAVVAVAVRAGGRRCAAAAVGRDVRRDARCDVVLGGPLGALSLHHP
jgi:hypothetical protein